MDEERQPTDGGAGKSQSQLNDRTEQYNMLGAHHN